MPATIASSNGAEVEVELFRSLPIDRRAFETGLKGFKGSRLKTELGWMGIFGGGDSSSFKET